MNEKDWTVSYEIRSLSLFSRGAINMYVTYSAPCFRFYEGQHFNLEVHYQRTNNIYSQTDLNWVPFGFYLGAELPKEACKDRW